MSLPALKQKTSPAPLQRPYRDFDAYVEAAKRFNDLCDKVRDEIGYRTGRLTPEELEHYKRLVVKWDQAFYECLAGYKVYESDEFYQQTETAKHLLGPDYETDRQIRRQVVGDKIGFLIGSFPNAGPHNPEIYVAMLIEEIVAANPSAFALEATCRQIRRTATFVPTLAEVLKILGEQETFWEGDGLLYCMREKKDWHAELKELARPRILTATTVMRGRARVLLTEVHYRKKPYFQFEILEKVE